MTVNDALRDLLAEAKPDVALDTLYAQAQRQGIGIGRNTIAKARRGELERPSERILQALAELFGVDIRSLRRAVDRQPGELGPYIPTERAAALTQPQRDALDRLIVTIVEQGGQRDGWQPEAEKSLTRSDVDLAARRGTNEGQARRAAQDAAGEETQDLEER